MKNKKKTIFLIILVIFLMAATGIGGWYLGSKYAKNENKEPEQKEVEKEEQEEPEETKEENDKESNNKKTDKKLEVIDIYSGPDYGFHTIYSDISTEYIFKDVYVSNYALDGDTIYYGTNGKEIYTVNVNGEGKPKKVAELSLAAKPFGVKDNKLYYIAESDSGSAGYVNAITKDLETGKETKKKLRQSFSTTDRYYGSTAVFHDPVSASKHPSFYTYNFETEKTTKIGTYDYVVESRANYLLFATENDINDTDYCLYNLKEYKEEFCLNTQKLNMPDIITNYMATTDGEFIYVISNDKIIGVKENNLAYDIYELTKEEAKAPYLSIVYVDGNILLTVGTYKDCSEGCSYDLTTYNVSDNHKELGYSILLEGQNWLYFVN